MHDKFHIENEFRFRASSELKIPRGELSFLIEITATDESKEHCAHIRIKDLAPTTKRDSSRTTAMMMMTKKMILPLPRRNRQGQAIHSFSSPWWPNWNQNKRGHMQGNKKILVEHDRDDTRHSQSLAISCHTSIAPFSFGQWPPHTHACRRDHQKQKRKWNQTELASWRSFRGEELFRAAPKKEERHHRCMRFKKNRCGFRFREGEIMRINKKHGAHHAIASNNWRVSHVINGNGFSEQQ